MLEALVKAERLSWNVSYSEKERGGKISRCRSALCLTLLHPERPKFGFLRATGLTLSLMITYLVILLL